MFGHLPEALSEKEVRCPYAGERGESSHRRTRLWGGLAIARVAVVEENSQRKVISASPRSAPPAPELVGLAGTSSPQRGSGVSHGSPQVSPDPVPTTPPFGHGRDHCRWRILRPAAPDCFAQGASVAWTQGAAPIPDTRN